MKNKNSDWSRSRNCTSENRNGKTTENKEPKKGMKLSIKARMEKKTAKSLLNIDNTANVREPVSRLVNVLSWK